MREINDHVKQVMGIKDKQPKPSANPKNWNRTAIATWAFIAFVVCNFIKFLIDII